MRRWVCSARPLSKRISMCFPSGSTAVTWEPMTRSICGPGVRADEALAPALHVQGWLTVGKHDVRASDPLQFLRFRPGQGGAVRIGRVGGGQELNRRGIRRRALGAQAVHGAGQGELGGAEALDEIPAPDLA